MRAQAELVEERPRIERNDRPDDDWLMRTADIVAEGEQGRCPRLQRPTESGNGGRAAQVPVRSVASSRCRGGPFDDPERCIDVGPKLAHQLPPTAVGDCSGPGSSRSATSISRCSYRLIKYPDPKKAHRAITKTKVARTACISKRSFPK